MLFHMVVCTELQEVCPFQSYSLGSNPIAATFSVHRLKEITQPFQHSIASPANAGSGSTHTHGLL